MAANTLPDPTVRSNLAQFTSVALDLDASQTIAQQHGVSAIPAFLVLNSAGDVILRTEGYRDARQFNIWLEEAKTAHAAAQEKVSAFRKQQAAIAADLKSDDAAARQKALTALLDLCADREPSHQQYATAQLKALAATDPKALLGGLEHPRLATRIAVANQLRETLGKKIAFDPWASPAERAKAVAELRQQPMQKPNGKPVQAEQQE
jgi:thioredoxin-like negative regulator of GroEL